MTARTEAVEMGPISRGRQSHHPLFAVAAVLLGSFLAGFDTRVMTIALADLKGGLSLSFDEGAWLSTISLAPQMLVAPAIAWLATAFGTRRVLGIPSLIYGALSLLIPFVREYEPLLILHFVRGLLIGTLVPATLIIIVRNLPMRWWIPTIGIYAFRAAFTLNAGVSLAGLYSQTLGWQWIYWQDVLIAPVMAACVYLGTPREPVNRDLLAKADWGGMLLFGAGLALIFAGIDQGNRLDWLSSGTVVGLLGGGIVLLLCFLLNESVVAHPWASVGVISSRNVGLLLIAAVLFTLTSVSNISLVPNFLISVGQLRSEQIGPLLFNYVAVPLAAASLAANWLLHRIDARLVLIAGLAAFAGASLIGTELTAEWRSDNFVVVALLQAIGFGFSFIAVIVIALSNSNPSRATAFSAYIQVLRLGGAEIGVGLMTTWLRVREQVHSNLIGSSLKSGDPELTRRLAQLTGRYAGHGLGPAPERAMVALSGIVQREANVLAYIDGFWLTFYLALAGILAVAFMKTAPTGPFTPHATRVKAALPLR